MSYRVRINDSSHSFSVLDGETVLDAAIRQGVNLPYGCRCGACGSCAATVLQGEVNYAELPPALEGLSPDTALLCQAHPCTDLLLEAKVLEGTGDLPVRRMPCKVAGLERLSHDVMRVLLKLPDTERLQFLAGQYIDFILGDGRRRAFSLANAPHDDAFLELHIRHVGDGEFTDHVFDGMQIRDVLRIEGPFGSFFLREDTERPIIFVAGGTGFAPIKGILEHAFATGIRRPMHLYWGVRARRDLYLDALPRAWQEEYDFFRYTPVLSAPQPGDNWPGCTGLVHEQVLRDYPDLSGFDIYAGGPPAMVQAGFEAFTTRGLLPEHYFSDAFEFANDYPKTRREGA